ncbi:MAG: histidinol-phosphatase [Candidatus Eisenbacteria bacterium]
MDFHVHCEYSIDGEGSVDEYARAALAKGLSHICFTTHYDLDPERRHHDGRVKLNGKIIDVTKPWLESYIGEVEAVSKAYAGRGLKVLCGLEVGYVPGIEEMIRSAVDPYEFDFLLGGVHTLSSIDIVSAREAPDYFMPRSPRQVCEEYYGYLEEAVRCGLFDCIAHIDIYKRCGLDFYGESLNEAHYGFVEPVLEAMATANLSLEINSGSLRKGLDSPYPSQDILHAAKSAGVSSLTFGSDCHLPEDVGDGLDVCLEIARSAGFDRIAVFEKRRAEQIPIEELNVQDR